MSSPKQSMHGVSASRVERKSWGMLEVIAALQLVLNHVIGLPGPAVFVADSTSASICSLMEYIPRAEGAIEDTTMVEKTGQYAG